MKRFPLFFMFGILTAGSINCNNDDLEGRRLLLDQKEKQLAAKEDSLKLKEQELISREKKLDSVSTDSVTLIDSSLSGNWDVKMVCIETTCHGSAVGDTKIETWHLAVQGDQYLATASSAGQISRIYKGILQENTLELTVQPPASPTIEQLPKITVRVNRINESRLEGAREITRDDCRIVYSLEMTKKSL